MRVQASDAEMRKLGQRLEETDSRQRQMMTFLANNDLDFCQLQDLVRNLKVITEI